jgi:hypothetical protein
VIFGIISVVGLECFLNGFAVKVELTDLKVDLGDGHFAQILVKLDFLLVENRVWILLPYLLYQIKGCIHLVVIGLDFLEPFNRLELETPCATLQSSSIEIVPQPQTYQEHMLQPLIFFQRCKTCLQLFHL